MHNRGKAVTQAIGAHALDWDGDNRHFVIETLLPLLDLRPRIIQVIRWAYGYDGSLRSYEKESNGSSAVSDIYMGGVIKEPYGVGHDMIFILNSEHLPDPDGHEWTWWESNNWYRRAMSDFGYPVRGAVRWAGLTLVSWPVWLRGDVMHKERS